MGTCGEYLVILGAVGAITVGGGSFIGRQSRVWFTQDAMNFHPNKAEHTSVRHGWGERLEITYRCDHGLPPGQRCQATTVTTPRDDRPGAALVAAACCGAAVLMARAGQRARRELLEQAGVEVLEARDGGYRQPGVSAKKALPPATEAAFRRRVAWAVVPWALGVLAAAARGHGSSPVPLPWATLAWVALSLAAALTVLRWHRGAHWAPALLLLAAAGQALAGDFSPAIAPLLLASLGALGAWFEERTRRREGRWRVAAEGDPLASE